MKNVMKLFRPIFMADMLIYLFVCMSSRDEIIRHPSRLFTFLPRTVYKI